MIVDFYHLTASPLEKVLPRICERLLADGQRLLVVVGARLLDELDEQLWSYSRDSFLPHARAEAGAQSLQPILLADVIEPANAAHNIAIADGVWRDEALEADRVFFLFDDSQADGARSAWTGLRQRDDVERRYWKQDSQGKWMQGP